jgi:PPOX class probable F420-dependent enzyme
LKVSQLPKTQENNAFAVLKGHKCISLTTFRKSGKPVSTPVGFAVESGKLYVVTGTKTGKFKRIRSNPKVQLAPCTMRGKVVGPTIEAVARILPAGEEALAERALKRKRGWMMRIGSFLVRLSGGRGEGVYLEIVPVEEEK